MLLTPPSFQVSLSVVNYLDRQRLNKVQWMTHPLLMDLEA